MVWPHISNKGINATTNTAKIEAFKLDTPKPQILSTKASA